MSLYPPTRYQCRCRRSEKNSQGALDEENKLEAGAYGYVYKVVVGGVERIAKKLHRILHLTTFAQVDI